MARSRKGGGVAIRLSLRDGELVRKGLVNLGREGEQALKKLDRASKPTSRGLLAVNAASQQAQGSVQTLAHRAGPLGTILTSIGPAGLVAAAGIGAVALALGGALRVARAATKEFAEVRREAQRAGVNAEAFQELSFVAQQRGIGIDALTDGLKELQLRADEFITTGQGSAAETFKRLGFDATDLAKRLEDPSELLAEITDRVQDFDKAAQIRIFDELFGGTGGEQFVKLIEIAGDGIRRLAHEARELGLVIDQHLLDSAEEMEKQLATASRVIDINLKRAFIDLAPAIVTVSNTIATAARALADFIDQFKELETRSTAGLERRLQEINSQLVQLQRGGLRQLVAGATGTISGLEKEAEAIQKLLDARVKATEPENKKRSAPGRTSEEAKSVEKLIDSLERELDVMRESDPVRRELIGLREQLKGATDDERARVEDLIKTRTEERAASQAAAQAQQELGQVMGDVFKAGTQGGEDMLDVLKRITLQLVEAEIRARAVGQAGALGNIFSSLFGGESNLSKIGASLAASTTVVPAAVLHAGTARVGQAGSPRRMDNAANWANAPRFHDGLMPGEFRGILQEGETVIPKGRSAGGVNITYAPKYNVQGSGPEIEALRAEIARDRAEAPMRIMKEIQEAQSRRMI